MIMHVQADTMMQNTGPGKLHTQFLFFNFLVALETVRLGLILFADAVGKLLLADAVGKLLLLFSS